MLLPLHTPSCSQPATTTLLSAHPTGTLMEQQHHSSSFPSWNPTCTWHKYNTLIYRHHHPSSCVCCRSSPTPSALWTQSPGGAQGAGHCPVPWCCQLVPCASARLPRALQPHQSTASTARAQTLPLLSLGKQNAASYTSNQVARINFPLGMLSC